MTGPPADTEAARTEAWFLDHGLTYFVPRLRREVRANLSRPRLGAALAVGLTLAVAVAVVVGLALGDASAGVALAGYLLAGAALWYALVRLHAGGIVRWALRQTFGSLRLLLPMASRALPLLLVFVTFLFINAEAWQMSASLSQGLLWIVVLLLLGLAVLFLLVRLPEEVDRVDDGVDAAFVRRTTRGTPAAGSVDRLLAEAWDPAEHAQVTGYDRWNLILVLLVVQILQVLLLTLTVFVFLVLFGSLVMDPSVQEAWTQQPTRSLGIAPNVSVALAQVALFLAAFSGLYFTVSAVTDDTYRGQFFASVTDELERAVGVRAVYLATTGGSGDSGGAPSR